MHGSMDFLRNIDLSPRNILKFAGLALLGVLVLALVLSFFKTSYDSFAKGGFGGGVPGMMEPAYYGGVAYDAISPSSYYGETSMQSLSARNVAGNMPMSGRCSPRSKRSIRKTFPKVSSPSSVR